MSVYRTSIVLLGLWLGPGGISQAGDEDWEELFTEGEARMFFDNQYFARDYRNGPNNSGRNRYKPRSERNGYRQEWGQSVQLYYRSGFTPGLPGLGFDAFAMQAFKLDSGGGRTGTGTLALDGKGHPRDSHGKVGGALKLKVAEAQLRYGNFTTQAPVLAANNSRIIPGMAYGWQLQRDWDGLSLEAAWLSALSGPTESRARGGISTVYGCLSGARINIDSAQYLGLNYKGEQWRGAYYLGQLEDVWTQHYLNLGHTLELAGERSLSNTFNLYRTRDSGASLFGPIDNLIASHALAYRFDAHRLTLAYQRSFSDTPFDYIGFGDGQTGQSIVLANSAPYSDFNGPRERSWQLRYDQRLAWLGLPDLNLGLRYQRGWGVDGSHAPANSIYRGLYGEDGRHHETDLDLSYTFSSGSLKGLHLRATQIWHRGNSAQADGSIDQLRIRVQYPLALF